ncbi:MAG: large conductance mechanosensitive channel protein MscL [Candidatus Alectryocaccobium sp.]|jgi:large conductance mechanosensitive channel
MKKLINEFKAFISRGSVIDLAVGMVIGAAFTAIVASLVNDIIMPLISIITGGISFEQWNISLGAGEEAPVLALGAFIAAVINFIIVAFVIFMVVKAINKFHEKIKKEEDAAEPTTKECPYCLSQIPIKATKCAHCTSDLLEETEA